MRWPWDRLWRAAEDVAPAATPPPPERPQDWRTARPTVRAVQPVEVAWPDRFAQQLGVRQPPHRALQRLVHDVRPDAPSGAITVAASATPATAVGARGPLPAARRRSGSAGPAVQRAAPPTLRAPDDGWSEEVAPLPLPALDDDVVGPAPARLPTATAVPLTAPRRLAAVPLPVADVQRAVSAGAPAEHDHPRDAAAVGPPPVPLPVSAADPPTTAARQRADAGDVHVASAAAAAGPATAGPAPQAPGPPVASSARASSPGSPLPPSGAPAVQRAAPSSGSRPAAPGPPAVADPERPSSAGTATPAPPATAPVPTVPTVQRQAHGSASPPVSRRRGIGAPLREVPVTAAGSSMAPAAAPASPAPVPVGPAPGATSTPPPSAPLGSPTGPVAPPTTTGPGAHVDGSAPPATGGGAPAVQRSAAQQPSPRAVPADAVAPAAPAAASAPHDAPAPWPQPDDAPVGRPADAPPAVAAPARGAASRGRPAPEVPSTPVVGAAPGLATVQRLATSVAAHPLTGGTSAPARGTGAPAGTGQEGHWSAGAGAAPAHVPVGGPAADASAGAGSTAADAALATGIAAPAPDGSLVFAPPPTPAPSRAPSALQRSALGASPATGAAPTAPRVGAPVRVQRRVTELPSAPTSTVQREEAVDVPAPEPVGAPAPDASAAAAPAGAPGAPAGGDASVEHLYERLRPMLERDLLRERERASLLLDL